ncbi:hypothetical protein COT20_02965 [bacterium (Candidatus Gribaldobacteria) CG08_land_8_20_14_0_20_39_15]|uniref:Uncharacterized protein n=1 Tax=bacterium (Candidatus Gribaldobacteria) CG08_land_8_20_14_0_20_39_15 TaxID=2014273 RepID=A0A2M6XTR2_9BACT|nr:MAG: hypothetical protein COT20_02965 [bacterium (Candidatus Gribaldobacteria) CG08_land_8_20_14_0_20_39_15]
MLEVCPKRNIFLLFIDWHFHRAALGIIKAWGNFLSFNLRYFSISGLCRTLFSHWRKISDSYGKGFDFQRFINAFLGNLISRFLGALVRLFLIIVGLAVEVFIFTFGLTIVLFWVLLPIWLALGLLAGIGLLI